MSALDSAGISLIIRDRYLSPPRHG